MIVNIVEKREVGAPEVTVSLDEISLIWVETGLYHFPVGVDEDTPMGEKLDIKLWNLVEEGDRFASMGDYETAVLYYFKAYRKSDKLNIDIIVKLVGALIQTRKYDQAADVLNISIKEAPRARQLHRMMALVQRARGDRKEEIRSLNKMISINGRMADAYIDKASAYVRMKKEKDAVKVLMKASRRLKREDTKGQAELVSMLLEMNKPDKARAPMEMMMKNSPKDTNYWQILARYRMENADFEGALKAIEEANRLDRDNKEILRTRAMIFLKSGKKDMAIHTIRQMLENDPRDHTLLKWYRELQGDV